MILTGGCACGATRYELRERPLFTHCCHCTWCQRETGSAFVLNALIEARHVVLTEGTTAATDTPSASGKGQVIHRCPNCRVALWSRYAGLGPRFVFLRVGTLDDSAAVPPDIHIYASTKLPWVTLDDGKPVMDEYYRRSEHWPEDSLRRREAELARADG